jgi:oxygen-independent coproporphyrinogen III oxidase
VTLAKPFSLYVHIPFCTAKCTYCDFNSYAGQDSLMTPYAEAVAHEARLWSPHLAGRQAETVFFGGGTPSLLPLPEMQVIIDAMRACFDIATEAEVSLEANPGTVDAAHLVGLRRLGFNRISFGVQSFHDEELRTLERIHDADEVEQAYAWARQAGFENINLDLIYGLQGQTPEGWQVNLERALAMEPEHLSLYALTLEDGTPLTRDVNRGRSLGPDLDLQADMFEWSIDRMKRSGYHHYEVSNWAKPDRECRHNLVYWRNGDWLGLGAGAHSHLLEQRFADAASPSRYIALINEAESTEVDPLEGMRQVGMREEADPAREMSETAFLALRLREGLDIAAFESRFGNASLARRWRRRGRWA